MTTTLYTSDHEWLAIDGDVATVGITDYAQSQLGDVVFVELPKVGRTLKKTEAAAVVESVKAASDVYSPVTGKVVEVNAALSDKPETINEDAYGDGWIFVIEAEEPEQLNELLDPDAYAELLEDEDH